MAALLGLSLAAAAPGLSPSERDIAESGRRYLERRPGLSDSSCTGLATAILGDAGYALGGTVRDIWDQTRAEGWNHRRKTPRPGDLAYFDYTWDVDGDGRADDRLSHIAVVIAVSPDGTVEMVHHGGGGIEPLWMNLYRPDVISEDGVVINSYLAAPGYGPEDRRLAGQLWAGFATVQGPITRPAIAASAAAHAPWAVERAPGRRERWLRRADDGAAWRYKGRRQLPPARTPEGRLLRGRRVGKAALWGSDCGELWYLRNAVYARHGYSFVTAEAAAVFGAEPWYLADPQLHEATADDALSARDARNVLRLLALEAQAGCGG